MKDLMEIEKKILKILEQDIAFQKEIAKKLGITRQTASKYLSRMEGRGIIVKKEAGTSYIYRLSDQYQIDRFVDEI